MNAIEGILALPEGPRRTAALVAWLQDLYETDREKPVLVGGAAVELYTGGAYTTGDLDFVGIVPSAVASALRDAGFERRGQHWIHEVEGHRVVVVDPEALVADRLAAWQVWKAATAIATRTTPIMIIRNRVTKCSSFQ